MSEQNEKNVVRNKGRPSRVYSMVFLVVALGVLGVASFLENERFFVAPSTIVALVTVVAFKQLISGHIKSIWVEYAALVLVVSVVWVLMNAYF